MLYKTAYTTAAHHQLCTILAGRCTMYTTRVRRLPSDYYIVPLLELFVATPGLNVLNLHCVVITHSNSLTCELCSSGLRAREHLRTRIL